MAGRNVLFTCPDEASAQRLVELCSKEGWLVPPGDDGFVHYHPDNLRFRYPTEFWMIKAIATFAQGEDVNLQADAIHRRADELAAQAGAQTTGSYAMRNQPEENS